KTHRERFDDLFAGAKAFVSATEDLPQRSRWLADYLGNPNIARYGIAPNLFFLADFVQAVCRACATGDADSLALLAEWGGERDYLRMSRQQATWLETLPGNLRRAAIRLKRMEEISRRAARTSEPLPNDRRELVEYGAISVIALAGYQSDFQATI